jgi:hypothetical protein
VVAVLPRLDNLDQQAVTPEERDAARQAAEVDAQLGELVVRARQAAAALGAKLEAARRSIPQPARQLTGAPSRAATSAEGKLDEEAEAAGGVAPPGRKAAIGAPASHGGGAVGAEGVVVSGVLLLLRALGPADLARVVAECRRLQAAQDP